MREANQQRGLEGYGAGFRFRQSRSLVAKVGTWVVLLAIVVVYFRIQILQHERYALRSRENSTRLISIPAPRGTVSDRHGRVIAGNASQYALSIVSQSEDEVQQHLDVLAPVLDMSDERKEALMTEWRSRPFEPITVATHVEFEKVAYIEERSPQFPRVVAEPRPARLYTRGANVGHIIGYLREISPEELERPEFAGYERGQVIGSRGIEAQYEHVLAGRDGFRHVEVNALGSLVRELSTGLGQPPLPGQDIQLGIDLELQDLAAESFPAEMRGGVVGIDPQTGEVLVLYSHPSFDPNDFTGGIPLDLWNQHRDDPGIPLLNRVTAAAYPPGSTWKPVVATVGLGRGDMDLNTVHNHPCVGGLQYGTRFFRCWNTSGHGSLDLFGALKHSCNVWFYQGGQGIGLDGLLGGVSELRFATRPTGLDLPYERSGTFPASREWYEERYGPGGWTESVVWNLSIGQGENQQTLLSMAQFYAAIATGEAPVQPHLLKDEVLNERRVDWSLALSDTEREYLIQALASVVNEPGGTAYGYRLREWELAGKTGTAQNPHGAPHSWFVGFAPAQDPKIVIASIVEQGHPDGQPSLAVPYAAGIVRRHLENLNLGSLPTVAVEGG